jgi:hypothetical protein
MFKFLKFISAGYFDFKDEERVSLDFFKNIENSLYLRTEDWVKLKSNILL